jgi:hypothetical protein
LSKRVRSMYCPVAPATGVQEKLTFAVAPRQVVFGKPSCAGPALQLIVTFTEPEAPPDVAVTVDWPALGAATSVVVATPPVVPALVFVNAPSVLPKVTTVPFGAGPDAVSTVAVIVASPPQPSVEWLVPTVTLVTGIGVPVGVGGTGVFVGVGEGICATAGLAGSKPRTTIIAVANRRTNAIVSAL